MHKQAPAPKGWGLALGGLPHDSAPIATSTAARIDRPPTPARVLRRLT